MLNYVCRIYVSDIIFRKIIYLMNSPVDSTYHHIRTIINHHYPAFPPSVDNRISIWSLGILLFFYGEHIQSSLSIHGGLVPGPVVDTKIHGCSSAIVSPLYL